MIELVQANASWIVLGLLFVLMMRMHGRGMGCCGGHQHGTQPREQQQEQESLPEARQEQSGRDDGKEKVAARNQRPSAGCH